MTTFTPNILRVATYNVIDEKEYDAMADEFMNNGIDIIALQGIKKLEYEKILRSMKSRGYSNYANPSAPYRSTFEVIFSRMPSKKEYIDFSNTNQHRCIIKYTYDIKVAGIVDPIPLVVLTSHMETGGTGNGNRVAQIKEMDGLVKDCSNVIFAGDTSIPSWQNLSCPTTGWCDAWREKGNNDNEITHSYDPIIGVIRDRPDRIWYKLSYDEVYLKCIDFALVCNAGYRRAPVAIFSVDTNVDTTS